MKPKLYIYIQVSDKILLMSLGSRLNQMRWEDAFFFLLYNPQVAIHLATILLRIYNNIKRGRVLRNGSSWGTDSKFFHLHFFWQRHIVMMSDVETCNTKESETERNSVLREAAAIWWNIYLHIKFQEWHICDILLPNQAAWPLPRVIYTVYTCFPLFKPAKFWAPRSVSASVATYSYRLLTAPHVRRLGDIKQYCTCEAFRAHL